MSTLDDINSFASDKQNNYPSAVNHLEGVEVKPVGESNGSNGTDGQQDGAGRTMSYVELMQQLSPYKPPTEEELAKERKKQKRDMVFAAIGDGLNAFHQAFANASGGKPMAPTVSLTGKLRERYEQLRKEREANHAQYANAYMRAKQADDAWRRTLERDKVGDERYNTERNDRQAQQKQQQDNWQQQFDRQSEQWKQEFNMREQQYGRQNALAWASHNLQVTAQKDSKELRQQQIAAQGAKGVRGKQISFSNGNGNTVNIYENVWKGSMEQVYDAIVADFDEQRKQNSNANVPRGLSRKATTQQKDDFVKQHWHKSEAGRRMMQTLAGIDPANMTNSSGNYDQYEVKEQEDYSQYEVQ